MRVFFALKPDALSLEQIIFIQRSIPLQKQYDTTAPREKLHVTLLFCGDVSTEQVSMLKKILTSIALQNPITLRGRYFAYFGNTYSKRLVLLFENDGELSAIHKSISAEVAKANLPCDVMRSFRPHVTLATIKSRLQLPQPSILLEFSFSEIILYESKLSATGSAYTALASTKNST